MTHHTHMTHQTEDLLLIVSLAPVPVFRATLKRRSVQVNALILYNVGVTSS
jgi:hypothetical protein